MIYFTPGPGELYPTVKKHIETAVYENILSISHRSQTFQEIYSKATSGLKELLKIPNDYAIFFLASATETMERIVQNTVETHSCHFVNGAFSDSFAQISKALGNNPTVKQTEFGTTFDFNQTLPKNVELITFTHNESSSGVMLDMKDIYKVKKVNPHAIVAVDTVSSVPYVDIDYRKVDCVFFSVQKGFGLPAGLGVLIVSPQALEKAQYLEKKGVSIGSYHTFTKLQRYAVKNQTPETPNVFNIYLLAQVTQDFLKTRIDVIRKQTEEKAEKLYSFFENQSGFKPFVTEKNARSKTVIVIETKQSSKNIINNLRDKGYLVGSGYGNYKEKHIRIANFPAHSQEDLKNLTKLLHISY